MKLKNKTVSHHDLSKSKIEQTRIYLLIVVSILVAVTTSNSSNAQEIVGSQSFEPVEIGTTIQTQAEFHSELQPAIQPELDLNQSLQGDFRTLWNQAHQEHRTTGFIDFNTYWDSRHLANTTLNMLANLPNDFQYFQLLNLESPIDSDSPDLTLFFTEINLRRAIAKKNSHLKHLDWTIQYADGTVPHGVLRFGRRWRLQDTPNSMGSYFKETLKLNYSINFHLIETDGTGVQIEHVYRREFFDGKVYIAGFCDHNIDNQGRNSAWVTEHQIGLQIFDAFYIVTEHRYNSFLPSGFRQGIGVGLEYVMRFK